MCVTSMGGACGKNSKIPEQKILMPGVEINLFRPAGRARYECRPLGHVGRCSSVMISSGRRRAGGKSLAVRRTKNRRRV